MLDIYNNNLIIIIFGKELINEYDLVIKSLRYVIN